ncbi:MAG: PEGA domain-containing protein [Planctomycetes bacterium]|nr:PEGA domain-containing protein [Planctomycetota bacterium]
MHGVMAVRIILAALICQVALAAEEPAVEKKAEAATQIYVRTAPPGAAVRLDGKDEGTAPILFAVPPGVTKMTVEVELDGARESRVIEVRGGKITRVEFELAEDEERATGVSTEMPQPASAPPPEAADGDAIRAVIATFVRLAREGLADKALAWTFVKELEDPATHISQLVGILSNRDNPAEIWDAEISGLIIDAESADALAYARRSTSPELAHVVATYHLQRLDGEWRIHSFAVVEGTSPQIARIDRHGPPLFDVTFEFVLPHPVRRHAELLDLDTGAYATMEEFGADDRATHRWVRDRGMDALGVIEGGTTGALLFDVATLDIPREKWSAITSEDIANDPALKQKEPDKITRLLCEPSSPVPTCIFRTREGSLGVLQVLGESGAPKGVRIRYRLASAPQSASAEQPEARPRRFVRVVIGEDAMTFQGTPASWERLPELLEAVPDRSRTVLELGAASAELRVARINEAMARLQPLVDDEVISLPVIRSRVADAIAITGAFTREETSELVERLKGGVSR